MIASDSIYLYGVLQSWCADGRTMPPGWMAGGPGTCPVRPGSSHLDRGTGIWTRVPRARPATWGVLESDSSFFVPPRFLVPSPQGSRLKASANRIEHQPHREKGNKPCTSPLPTRCPPKRRGVCTEGEKESMWAAKKKEKKNSFPCPGPQNGHGLRERAAAGDVTRRAGSQTLLFGTSELRGPLHGGFVSARIEWFLTFCALWAGG